MKLDFTSQKGFSLIEILIALLISTVIALAILRAYVTTIHTVGNSANGAKSDGNVIFGFATAERILQGAGFGVASPSTGSSYGQTLQAYKDGAAVELNAVADSLVWRSGAGLCQALIISNRDNPLNVNSATHTGSGLYYYGGTSAYSCSNLSLPSSTSTEVPQVLVPFNDINTSLVSLRVNGTASCTPYGISNTVNNGSGAYSVLLTANVYAGSGQTQNTVTNRTCLFNFK